MSISDDRLTEPVVDRTPAEPPVHDAAAEEMAADSPARSPWKLAVRRFSRHRLAVVGLVLLLIIIAAAVFAPLIASHEPNAIDLEAIRQPPSADHLLGTDSSGRDVFARMLFAGRVSLMVGFAASLLSCLIGAVLGAFAGIMGGWVDNVVMRAADVFLSFPALIVLIVLAGILGPSLKTMVIAFGVFSWPTAGRVVRGITLSLREQEFLQASRSFGAGPVWLVGKHVLPAVLGQLVVVATLAVATGILIEASMSFLGLGVQPPTASWGNMLNEAQRITVISSMPWLWIPPGIAVALSVLCVNFVGDGLRDALDPKAL